MKFRALLLTAALLATSVVAHAGSRHALGLTAGAAMPNGDLSDFAGTGYVIGGLYEYRIDPAFGVGGVIDYFSLGSKSTSSTVLGSTRTVKHEVPGGQAMVFGRYYFPLESPPVSPYVSLALEKVRIGFKSTVTYRGASAKSEDKQDKVGFGLGLGATRRFDDRMTGGAEVAFHQVDTEGTATHLVTLTLHCTFGVGR